MGGWLGMRSSNYFIAEGRNDTPSVTYGDTHPSKGWARIWWRFLDDGVRGNSRGRLLEMTFLWGRGIQGKIHSPPAARYFVATLLVPRLVDE